MHHRPRDVGEDAGRTDRHHQIEPMHHQGLQPLHRACRQRLAEEHDIGPHHAATNRAGGWNLHALEIRQAARVRALGAAQAVQVAVDLDQVARTRQAMKAIDVLGQHPYPATLALERGNDVMGDVGPRATATGLDL
ncbi:hypothetical protein RZS08_34910, partial [Arthrospira platensis SPKY1]|nr:hypothetical protein [Arthrospira platensis SPKY1]